MRAVAVLAVLSFLAVALAGCSGDPERYPNGVSTSSSPTSRTGTTTTHTNATVNTTVAPPTANLTVSPANGTAPLNVTLSLDGNVSAGSLAWTLLFGDGNRTNGTALPATLVHRYSGGGNYTPTLTVTDGDRNTTVTANLTVLPGSVGYAPGLDPNCQRPDAHEIPPAGGAAYYVDDRGGGSVWNYEESNDIPGLQLTQEPGTAPAPVGGPGDVDSLAVQYNCQGGDTLIA